MNDFKPLGPPLPRDEDILRRDLTSIEATTTPDVWKVDGKYQTWIPGNEKARRPITNPPAVDLILDILKQQEEDGFPVHEWGSW